MPATWSRRWWPALALGLAIPAGALAHHGWSSYDSAKVIKVSGPLTEIRWRNPHAEAKLQYGGKAWEVVMAPTSRMEARGLTADMLKEGIVATVEAYPRSDGTAEMRAERMTIAGKTVEFR